MKHRATASARRILALVSCAGGEIVLGGSAAWGQEANRTAASLDPVSRVRVLAASLLLVALCLVLLIVVWWSGRFVRSLYGRDSKRLEPTGNVGPSDWSLPPLAPVGRRRADDRSFPADDDPDPPDQSDESGDDFPNV